MALHDNREALSLVPSDLSGCVAVFAYLDDTIVGVPLGLANIAMPLAVEMPAPV